MPKGLSGADSSKLVTRKIGNKTLIDLAEQLYGTTPKVWGRYFKKFGDTDDVQYQHAKEGQALREKDIRVLPLGRQTTHVGGSEAKGREDAIDNVEAVIRTFGAEYLASAGGDFILWLDVEDEGASPALSRAYWRGWARTVVEHSRSFTDSGVTLRPGIYCRRGSDASWEAIRHGEQDGTPCAGIWLARWRHEGCSALLDWDPDIVNTPISLQAPILCWQYANDCHGGDGFDCDEINPDPQLRDFLLARSILPPGVGGAAPMSVPASMGKVKAKPAKLAKTTGGTWQTILATANTEQTLARANTGLGRSTIYKLGAGGNAGDIPKELAARCDCSGFVCWAIGVPRECPPGSDHWLFTDNIWEGGGDVGDDLFIRVSSSSAVPGDFYVYPAPSSNHHGHIGIITETLHGAPSKMIHCSLSNYDNTGDAVRTTSPAVIANNPNARIVRPDYDAIRRAADLAKKADPKLATMAAAALAEPTGTTCSDGWFVTGYYTASEDMFSGHMVAINVPGVGSVSFPADFLKHVKIEGWGETRFGWFLGFDDGWVKGSAALNAVGRPLQIGSLAVDPQVIALGTKVRIPNLKAPWNQQLFVADDKGGAIQGQHVDVYCGAGPEARAETLRITENDRRLCRG